MTGKFLMGIAATLLLTGVPATAQSLEATACPVPKLPSGELAAWGPAVPLVTANDVGGLADARVQVGQTAELALHPIGAVSLPVPAGREGGNGGLAALTITRAGTYRVALGSAAWVDLVAAGKVVQSVAHGHGPACTGIRKIVEFRLPRGRYTIVVSGNLEMRTQLLVAASGPGSEPLHP